MSGALDLDAIRARAAAASEGPWGTADMWGQGVAVHRGAHDTIGLYLGRPDAEFIAHAREDVPALLREIERLRADRDEQGRYLSVVDEFARTTGMSPREVMGVVGVKADLDRAEATLARVRELADRWEQIGRDGGANHRLAAAWLRTALTEETK